MIYKLQKKFILVSAVSIFAVIIVVFSLMTVFNTMTMNRNLDSLADNIKRGGGEFTDSFGYPYQDKNDIKKPPSSDFITPETRFQTRYFSVTYDNSGEVIKTNTKAIYAITEETALNFADTVSESNKTSGWVSCYRYKVFDSQDEKLIVFVDGNVVLTSYWQTVSVSACVLLGCAGLILLLIFLLSKKAVKPFADNYIKQKQFVTDANHELKTPLTLILANIDIAEAELGKNEWLDDIKSEGLRMTELVNQLVALSRADEDSMNSEDVQLQLSEIAEDTVSEFSGLISEKGKTLVSDICPGIIYRGDEALMRRLISILMDNAVKYSDENGEIRVFLGKKRSSIVLTVENTYRDVNNTELNKLFDRFYRADKARTYDGGFGVGLSIAKGIVHKYKGEITAYKKDDMNIGFKAVFK